MLLELLATLCSGLFAGAAIYINLVEHPARLECGTRTAVTQWRTGYRRAAAMQASLALIGLVAAVAAWGQGRGVPVLFAGLLLGAVVPFTLIVILPTTQLLLAPTLDADAPAAAALLKQWGHLHAVRSAAALIALGIFLLHLGGML